MLFYTTNPPLLTDDIFYTTRQRKWIEIFPQNQPKFDLIALLDFADSLTDKYFCTNFATYSNVISIKARHITLKEPNSESVKITITDNYTNIHVYLKDSFNQLNRIKINDIYFICFHMLFQDKENFLFFNSTNNMNKYLLYPNSVLYTLGNYVAKKPVSSPKFLKVAFNCFLCIKTQKQQQSSIPTHNDLYQMVQHLPGFVLIKTLDSNDCRYLNLKFLKRNGSIFTYNNVSKVLKGLVYIMPWAVEIVRQMHFLEIDASFKAIRPYNYCIFHCVIYNSSIPFALSIYPTEKTQLYELLFDGLSHFKIDSGSFEKKHVLSDMGDAIISFSKKHFMQNHFCHRHLIEAFGANSGFGFWVRKILKCKTKIEFLQIREEILAEIYAYKEKVELLELNQKILDKINEKLCNIEIMLTLPEEIENEKNTHNEKIIQSKYFLPKWANWYRRAYHIPRCSNHSEGAHGNINQTLNKHGTFSIKSGIKSITDYIFSYLKNREESFRSLFNKKHSKIREKIREILKKKDDQYLQFSQKNCDCEDDIYNLSIYGVKFPCIHTVLHKLIFNDFFQNVILKTDIDFYELFLLSFKFCPNSFYEGQKYDSNIDLLVQKICSFFCTQYPFYQNDEMIPIISQLSKEFLQCFRYELPPFIKIDFDNYKKNYTSVIDDDDEVKKIIFNKKNCKYAFNQSKEKEDNKEINFWFSETDDEIDKLIKEKYFQVKHEIRLVYPKLGEDIDSLCFYNYMEHIKKVIYTKEDIEKNDLNILAVLATFKIECWISADNIAGENRFFG